MTYFYILYLQMRGGGKRPSLFQHVSQPVETKSLLPTHPVQGRSNARS